MELLGNLTALVATVLGLTSTTINGAQVGVSISYAVQVRKVFCVDDD